MSDLDIRLDQVRARIAEMAKDPFWKPVLCELAGRGNLIGAALPEETLLAVCQRIAGHTVPISVVGVAEPGQQDVTFLKCDLTRHPGGDSSTISWSIPGQVAAPLVKVDSGDCMADLIAALKTGLIE